VSGYRTWDDGEVLNLEEKLFLSQNMYSDPAESKENAVAEATALLTQIDLFRS
jgi:hypothetical protein